MRLFGSLPVELIEDIVSQLDLADIRNLRLTSREVCNRCTGWHFKSFCNRKNVDLRVADLKNLAEKLQPRSIPSSLEHLTITGVLYVTKSLERTLRQKTLPGDRLDPMGVKRDAIGNHTGAKRVAADEAALGDAESQLEQMREEIRMIEDERASGSDLQELTRLLETIRRNCRYAGLKSLKLDVAVYRDMHTRLPPASGAMWPEVWKTAMNTFRTAVQALYESGISVEELDIYSQQNNCAVPVLDITNLQEQLGARDRLRKLSLSSSNRVFLDTKGVDRLAVLDTDPDEWDLRCRGASIRSPGGDRPPPDSVFHRGWTSAVRDEQNWLGLAQWLQRLPKLEELDLHHTSVRQEIATSEGNFNAGYGHEVLGRIAAMAPLPQLKKLSLRGYSVLAPSLLAILRQSPDLESLELRDIVAESVSSDCDWNTILDYLTRATTKLSHLYLDGCFTGFHREYVVFRSKTLPVSSTHLRLKDAGSFHKLGGPAACGVNAFQLDEREKILMGIRCEFHERWQVGSQQQSKWRVERQRVYYPNRTWQ